VAVRTVLQLGDPGLREVAVPVVDPCAPEIATLVQDLADTLAQITWRSNEKIVVWDACLSFLSIFMQVERHREITVRYQDLRGEWKESRASEERDLSELLQHEIDHLDGILAVDRIKDMRTMCTREEFEKRYRAQSPYALASGSR
jgi:peptide deformylase